MTDRIAARTVAALILAIHGDKPDEIVEHPWLEGSPDILLMADLPEFELTDLPFMTPDPEPLLPPLWPTPPQPLLTRSLT